MDLQTVVSQFLNKTTEEQIALLTYEMEMLSIHCGRMADATDKVAKYKKMLNRCFAEDRKEIRSFLRGAEKRVQIEESNISQCDERITAFKGILGI